MEFKLWDIVYVQYVISIILLLQFCQKCSIVSFSERNVYFFHFFNLSKMAHFVILEKRSSNYEYKYDFSTPYVVSHQIILSKMLNFVIFWEARVFFHFQYCHQRPILSFWKSEIQIMRYSISTICDLNYFASSILSEMLNFVIFWEACVFFSLFQFVTNGPFCQFWEVDFKLWDKYKLTTSTLCVLINQTKSILSKMLKFVICWEGCIYFFFHFFNIVKNGPWCHFGKAVFKFWDKYDFSTPYVVSHQTILSKMLNFVIFWEARVFFHFSILSPKAHFVILEKWNSNYEI